MDVVSAASNLRDHLVVLDAAQKQKELIDNQITSLSQQSLTSSLHGNTVKCLQLSLRLSVSEGVQQIYQQISDKKWHQVQTTARSFLSEDTELPVSVPTSTDKTTSSWSRHYCDFYRDS